MNNGTMKKIRSLSHVPTKPANWLGNAQEGVEFMKENMNSEHVVIYANGPHVITQSVLVPAEKLKSADRNLIRKENIFPDQAWGILEVFHGGDHSISLEHPLSRHAEEVFGDGEKLIFERKFLGMDDYESPIEISQKLVHSLDVHFIKERRAYCRLDKRGNLEDVIAIHVDRGDNDLKTLRAVSIRHADLAKYMTLTKMSMVSYFDFTRCLFGEFKGWPTNARSDFKARDLCYSQATHPGYASYRNGFIITHSIRTIDDLANEYKMDAEGKCRKYESFLIVDIKNEGKLVTTSCGPDSIVNYFIESDLPLEMSPAFFNPEVLHRYKFDDEKYTIGYGSIECRGAWNLRSFDINDAGQVHAYIGDLAKLPYEEQQYWKLYNEEPLSGLSARAIETDFQGDFPTNIGHIDELKEIVREMNTVPASWWNPRDDKLFEVMHGPATDVVKEWGDELLALDHLVAEGFKEPGLKKIISSNGGSTEEIKGALNSLEAALGSQGQTEEHSKSIVAPLREVRALRNVVKAHGSVKRREEAVKEAREKHGTLRLQFIQMAGQLIKSLNEIRKHLPK